MLLSKEFFGLLASVIGLASYVFYFHDMFTHRTKPHAFSWGMWAFSGLVIFAAEYAEHAGPGSWLYIVEILGCSTVFCWALVHGEKSYTVFDWLALVLGLLALALWWITKTPTLSVILITVVEFCAFFPTYRKSFHKPFEESAMVFVLSPPKSLLTLFAIEHYTVATVLYPLSLVVLNTTFVTLLLIRRKQLGSV